MKCIQNNPARTFRPTEQQKRLYYSPHGDSICGAEHYAHSWTYSLLGAYGAEHAIYKGKQTASELCSDTGRRVYMHPIAYLTNGGEMASLPDTTKEFRITDNLGSIRCLIALKGTDTTFSHFDFKPFGDSLRGNAQIPRLGFNGMEKDRENDYIAMGARMYDTKTGRFLSVDPLAEFFPGQTPYQYAFNSPMTWRDPSGLAPEKEKRSDRIQALLSEDRVDFSLSAGSWALSWTLEKTFTKGTLCTPLIPGTPDRYEYDLVAEYQWIPSIGGEDVQGASASSGFGSGPSKFASRKYNPHTFIFRTHISVDYSLASENYAESGDWYIDPDNPFPPNASDINIDLTPIRKSVETTGVYAGAVQYSYYCEELGYWKGMNGKYYSTDWGGNGITGGKNKFARSASGIFKWAGRIFFGVSTSMSIINMANYYSEGGENPGVAIKTGVDFTVGIIGLSCGPLGMASALGYYSIGLTGYWDYLIIDSFEPTNTSNKATIRRRRIFGKKNAFGEEWNAYMLNFKY